MNKYVRKLRGIFLQNKDKIFVTSVNLEISFTYREINVFALKLASFLYNKGIKKGDRVTIFLPNCIEYVVIYFACMQIGAIVVPINHKLHKNEIKYILSKVDTKFLFTTKEFQEQCFDIFSEIKNIISFYPNDFKQKTESSLFSYIQKKDFDLQNSFNNILDNDLLAIMFTSGTTGFPKGIEITYGKLIANGLTFINSVQLSSDLNFYNILDLAYLGGFYNLMLIPFFCEGSIVLSEVFNPGIAIRFWDNVARHKVNALWLVPSLMSMLLLIDRSDFGQKYCLNNIKKILVGTAPLSNLLKKDFESKYGVRLYENYGLSETFFVTTNSSSNKFNKGVGKVLPRCNVCIIDSNGDILGTKKEGEVVVNTDFGIKKYLDKKELLPNNFCTGDIGYIDDDGYLFITGRKKDLIIRGGINISPKQIEDVLYSHPAIKEVAVVGASEKFSGEQIVAAVCLKKDVKVQNIDLMKFCRNNLAKFKVPQKILFFNSLPRSVTGKINKNKIRKIVLDGEV